MILRPMLQVADVGASSRWYHETLGLRSGHGGDEYEMLFDGDDFILQLHLADAHEHGMDTPGAGSPAGVGMSLWFETSDRSAFDTAVERARGAGATLAPEPTWNPIAHHYEIGLRDPDGYMVILCSPFSPEP